MTRQIVVVVAPDGKVEIAGDDLPDLSGLEVLVGAQAIDEELRQLGLDIALNAHLCG